MKNPKKWLTLLGIIIAAMAAMSACDASTSPVESPSPSPSLSSKLPSPTPSLVSGSDSSAPDAAMLDGSSTGGSTCAWYTPFLEVLPVPGLENIRFDGVPWVAGDESSVVYSLNTGTGRYDTFEVIRDADGRFDAPALVVLPDRGTGGAGLVSFARFPVYSRDGKFGMYSVTKLGPSPSFPTIDLGTRVLLFSVDDAGAPTTQVGPIVWGTYNAWLGFDE